VTEFKLASKSIALPSPLQYLVARVEEGVDPERSYQLQHVVEWHSTHPKVGAELVYHDYQRWCEDNSQRPLKPTPFYQQVRKFFECGVTKGVRQYRLDAEHVRAKLVEFGVPVTGPVAEPMDIVEQ
jgi:phage/plasmid-associated DNA primase